MNVVVVGAGVIGLTAALELAENGYTVEIVAANVPTDPLTPKYTSPWAGAHYRPFPSKSLKEFEESQLTRATLRRFRQLHKAEPQSSIEFIEGVDLLEEKGIYDVGAKGYYEDISGLRELRPSELPAGVQFGARYDTWVVNSPLYIQYLQRKLMFKHGVRFTRLEAMSLRQVAQKYPGWAIVNATGLGLQFEGGYDPSSYVIRGQTLLVRAPQGTQYEHKTVTYQARDGTWCFVIKRPLDGGFILGGTKQVNEYDPDPKPEDTQKLIANGRRFFPDLFIDGQLDIRNINVGFRPARHGGIRVEKEVVDGTTVVHAYGCGGMGYEVSYGVAEKVLSLLQARAKL